MLPAGRTVVWNKTSLYLEPEVKRTSEFGLKIDHLASTVNSPVSCMIFAGGNELFSTFPVLFSRDPRRGKRN